MPFKNSLQVSMVINSNIRKLSSPLIYLDSKQGLIEAPRDFETNYASIPKAVPQWWLDQDDPLIREPSVIHDWLYSVDCPLDLSRKEADEVLLRAMLEVGVRPTNNWYRNFMNKLKAKSAYRSVRIAGSAFWKNSSNT